MPKVTCINIDIMYGYSNINIPKCEECRNTNRIIQYAHEMLERVGIRKPMEQMDHKANTGNRVPVPVGSGCKCRNISAIAIIQDTSQSASCAPASDGGLLCILELPN